MIKLYRKTFIFSCYIFLVAFVLSIVFERFQGQVKVFSFFENYAIGIACSGALVATTTFLQFKSEFNQTFRPLAAKVSTLVSLLSSAIIYENDPSAFEREHESSPYDWLNSATKNACEQNYVICLGRKRQKLFEEISMLLYLFRFDFTRGKSNQESVKAIANSKRVFELIDLSLKAFPDCTEKEEIRESKVKLEHFIEEREKRGDTP